MNLPILILSAMLCISCSKEIPKQPEQTATSSEAELIKIEEGIPDQEFTEGELVPILLPQRYVQVLYNVVDNDFQNIEMSKNECEQNIQLANESPAPYVGVCIPKREYTWELAKAELLKAIDVKQEWAKQQMAQGK